MLKILEEVRGIIAMASSKEYLHFIINQLSDLEGITYRTMMGEYIIYYGEKIVGGIYDNRLLVKPVEAILPLLSNIRYELPYEGAKEMLLIEDVQNKELLKKLFSALYEHLPTPKKK